MLVQMTVIFVPSRLVLLHIYKKWEGQVGLGKRHMRQENFFCMIRSDLKKYRKEVILIRNFTESCCVLALRIFLSLTASQRDRT